MTTEPPIESPDKSDTSVAKSLVLVNTGEGKGKSSAAFGVMVRGLAMDWPVAVVPVSYTHLTLPTIYSV